MVVDVLAADGRDSVRSSIVAPAEDAGIRDVVGQEAAEPVDAITCSPCFLPVAVEAMDGDNAERGARSVRSYKTPGSVN